MSPDIRKKLEVLFPHDERDIAATLLETECGANLPLIDKQGAEGIERVRCAALKLSEGSLPNLERAVEIAKFDWRDVLVAAGFANDLTAHSAWLNDQ
jgi:hypothetical protein